MPKTFAFDRYCDEIIEQTRLFRETLQEATLPTQVPTCPEWTLRQLAVHLGVGNLWTAETVRRRATEMLPEEVVADLHGPARQVGTDVEADADTQALDVWLAEGAQQLVDELRAAGEDERVWTWFTDQRAGFWARRRANEAVVHRADAAATAEIEFEVDPEVAADCVDEWLEIVASPLAAEHNPSLRTLRERAGSTLHLHATDTDAEWLITLAEDGISCRRAHEKADVALRGPMADVMRVFFRRLPPISDRVEVLGDAELLDFWLKRVSFD
ncbi:MAG: maleylpyruvate isomerase N-terminal domain-containing protein [Streptomyces sp.]|uniref:maleylpyruvate isomerase N-terminal domain-containing protein n=1 Tax=Streptomyces sp. TaxID=1931 RepID=UPI003D6B34D8